MMVNDTPGILPHVVELPAKWDKMHCFERLCRLPHCLFLDSATVVDDRGRYSFLAADPFEFESIATGTRNVPTRLRRQMSSFVSTPVPGLPPFQGGAAGLIAYDLNRSLEAIALPRRDVFELPAVALGLYDVVLAFDHHENRQWLISQGFPETEVEQRRERAKRRADTLLEVLNSETLPLQSTRQTGRADELRTPSDWEESLVRVDRGDIPIDVFSNFSGNDYLAAVRRVVDYIRKGDVFQVNLAQQLFSPATTDSVTLYRRLRGRNPAPFAAYFDIDGSRQIVSASPERFLQVRQRRVESRPIKGTRRRQALPEADFYAGQELRDSEKDKAENVMIVDLLRNDLARVCEPGSVRVTQLCDLETYEFVLHLVSAVEGVLRPDCDLFDLLDGAFPGGSITGAPKVRAMEIIQELEPDARGAYCGSLGYLGFDGTMDMNILIRTITAANGWWQIPVGGGIVVQSSPQAEYEETWHKAHGMLKSLVP